MPETFFISDTHFGHANIIQFLNDDGGRIRPFDTIEDMDERMVTLWNERVRSQDRIYHLGDVVMNRRCLKILDRLNGKKVLIKGNHDIFPLKDYLPYFEDIRAYKVFSAHSLICSHIPVHTCQLEGRWVLNAHGHLHQKMVMMGNASQADVATAKDPRYRNVCVEHTNYAPVTLGEILEDVA